jgi:hypothetical protein
MEAKAFQEKIKNYAEQYRDWKNKINEFQLRYQQEYNIGAADREGLKRLSLAVQEYIAQEQMQNVNLPKIIISFLNQEYEAYLNATQEECNAIRASFSINRDFEDFLLEYVYNAAKELRSTKDVTWLERGLVGVSLENSGRDYRDTIMSLDELF